MYISQKSPFNHDFPKHTHHGHPGAPSHAPYHGLYAHLLKPSLNKRAALNSTKYRAIYNTPGKNRNGFLTKRPSPFLLTGRCLISHQHGGYKLRTGTRIATFTYPSPTTTHLMACIFTERGVKNYLYLLLKYKKKVVCCPPVQFARSPNGRPGWI